MHQRVLPARTVEEMRVPWLSREVLRKGDSYSFAIVLSMVENPPIVVESVGDDVFTIYVSVGFL